MDDQLLKTLIVNNIHIGIYVLDKNGNYIYCNNTFLRMTGGTREKVMGLNAHDLVKSNQVKHSAGVEALETKQCITMVNEVTTPRKFKYKQLITATPIFDEKGEIEYVVVETSRIDLLQGRYQKGIERGEEYYRKVDNQTMKEELIHESEPMNKLLKELKIVAITDATILVTGETGVGKEVVVQYVHKNSNRHNKQIVEINCAALPENLLEAELYGYVKGAFTGALNEGKEGMIEKAQGGTLFLDEINSMPLALQGKLLRVLETHKTKRLGALNEKTIDFRLIAATNQDLRKCVENGSFREDLYYRLSVVPVEVPPLRDRVEDIKPLAITFLENFCNKYGYTKVFSNKAIKQLEKYDWPGNVRELKNLVERLFVSSLPTSMEIAAISEGLFNMDADAALGELTAGGDRGTALCGNKVSDIILPDDDWGDFSLEEYLDGCEKAAIEKALIKTNSTYKAAELLKINQSTVFRKKQKYNL